MKTHLHPLVIGSTVLALSFAAVGENHTNKASGHPDYTREIDARGWRGDRLHGAVKSSDLIGLTVKNYEGKKLGKIDELAVDVESGRVVLVILSSGGVAGIGNTLVAVPPSALHHDADNKVVHLRSDEARLKAAPKFDSSKWTEQSSASVSETYRYYGEERSLRFIGKGTGEDRSRNMIPEARLGQLQKASSLVGMSVKNPQDEKLGKVENILVDLASGRLVAVVVSSGGFLGLGDELSAVPPTALKFNSDRNTLQLDVTKESLANAPHFKANEWPDMSRPDYADRVYRAYKVEPYFSTNAVPEADNTRRNVRDRDNRTPTPFSQGGSQADTDTTAQIRKGVMAAKNLSVNAQNVKIITSNGRVTLRGPVNTAEEKRLIGEIAGNIASVENVDNQLEVK